MKRMYESLIKSHFENYEQMVFLSGPRQSGKTTIARSCAKNVMQSKYMNWDDLDDRANILDGYKTILSGMSFDVVLPQKPLIIFDEIHKYKDWKNFIKGFVDAYKSQLHIVVTGSAKLNIMRRGGDSLMGRYFLYRIHPFSVAETHRTTLSNMPISPPMRIHKDTFQALFQFGGFPEPFIKQESRFYNRWQNLRQQQMIKEDVSSIAKINEVAQLELLALLIKHQAGQLVTYSNLASKARIADTTVRRWLTVLESFYYCFTIKPWTQNVARSLIKEPKIYLWDWSVVEDKGAKVENFLACHLLKAVHYWNDAGFGNYELYFLRDKDKNEVDFLVTCNKKPWLIVEAKTSAREAINPNLYRFQQQLKAKHALQVAFDLPYIDIDCFQFNIPKIVSMQTFLSQLV